MERPNIDELQLYCAGEGPAVIQMAKPDAARLVAYTLDLERRVALVDAVADLLLAMHPLGCLNRMEIGRLVGCVRTLRPPSADPVPDFSAARDAWRGRGG